MTTRISVRRLLGHRPSPAMVVACIALAIALGGTSYAAISLPANSVGTNQLKNGAVTDKKVKAGAVTPAKLGKIPQVRIEIGSAQSIPTDTQSGLTWSTVRYDTAGFFNPANPDQLTAPIAGVYAIEAGVRWEQHAGGYRAVGICLNEVPASCSKAVNIALSQHSTSGNPAPKQSVSTQVKLAAGDVVRVVVAQDSGASVAVDASPGTHFAMSWIGRG